MAGDSERERERAGGRERAEGRERERERVRETYTPLIHTSYPRELVAFREEHDTFMVLPNP